MKSNNCKKEDLEHVHKILIALNRKKKIEYKIQFAASEQYFALENRNFVQVSISDSTFTAL